MKATHFCLNLNSERPDELFRFYRDCVGLPFAEGMGERAVLAGPAVISFDGHSEVRGGAKEPQRYLIDLFVEDIAAEQARLEAGGVTFIRRKGREEWGGVISTFLDLDGNYVQLIEYNEGAS